MNSPDVSSSVDAWSRRVLELASSPASDGLHISTSFQCQSDYTEQHMVVSDVLQQVGLMGIEQVANTIFPQSLYHPQSERAATLLYDNWNFARRVNSRHRGRRITYFDRMTHYPTSNGDFNQIEHQLERLKHHLDKARPFKAIYEVGISSEAELRLMAPATDRLYRGFPCLSHVSLTLLDDKIHLMAQYRYQYMIAKALGNYLGLSRLLNFFALELGIAPGKITVNSAYTLLDVQGHGGKRRWIEIASSLRSCDDTSQEDR